MNPPPSPTALVMEPGLRAFAVLMRDCRVCRDGLALHHLGALHPTLRHALPNLPIRRRSRLLSHIATLAGVPSELVQ